MLLKLAVAAALSLCVRQALAQQPASNPTPPVNADFLVTPSPILTPWQNGASSCEGFLQAVGASVTRLNYGPCVYRGAHRHNFVWEVQTPISPAPLAHHGQAGDVQRRN